MSSSSLKSPLRIGMFGGGTVGGGVYEILMDRLGGKQAVVSKICVRDLNKPRSFNIKPEQTEMVSDPESILADPNIDMVVEVMGGTHDLVKRVVLDSLKGGKKVVTANKALIAAYLEDIQSTTVQTPKARFGYEASVCGAIPIIHTLQTCYTGDVIHKIMGICNGTTNFMLGKMELGMNYNEVLKEAQDLGFAEADPSADVDGYDVQAKICILAKLAFGVTVPQDNVPCIGITKITPVDFEYAKLLGCTIKLVGTATRNSNFGEHDGPLSVFVTPTVVPLTHLLASARGPGNAVAVTSANLGIASYTGPGAGRFPTANSIVADVLRCAKDDDENSDPFPLKAANVELNHDYSASFYVRITFCDGLGIIKRVGELAEQHGISIHAVLQNPIVNPDKADFVVTTENCRITQVQGFCKDLASQDWHVGDMPLYMPML